MDFNLKIFVQIGGLFTYPSFGVARFSNGKMYSTNTWFSSNIQIQTLAFDINSGWLFAGGSNYDLYLGYYYGVNVARFVSEYIFSFFSNLISKMFFIHKGMMEQIGIL